MNLWSPLIGLAGVIVGIAIKYLLDRRTERERAWREDRLRFLDVKRETYALLGATVLEHRYSFAIINDELEELRAGIQKAGVVGSETPSPEMDAQMRSLEARVSDLDEFTRASGKELRRHMALLQLIAPQSVIDAAWRLTEQPGSPHHLSETWSNWVAACRHDLEHGGMAPKQVRGGTAGV